jgi:transposase
LAGNRLPKVWIPDPQTRDDRELVRTRLDAADKLSAVKVQIKGLLKRNALTRPDGLGSGHTRLYFAWLRGLVQQPDRGAGFRGALDSLLRQIKFLEEEIDRLTAELSRLAAAPRYAARLAELTKLKGVGLLTALVFLSELGNLNRFENRRQISAYLGLAPSSFESGQASDRKGHITHQGPSRVRRVLCQATWARVRTEASAKAAYQRIAEKNPKRKKIALVAAMRQLAVLMWHRGKEASCSAGCATDRPPGCRTPAPLASVHG